MPAPVFSTREMYDLISRWYPEAKPPLRKSNHLRDTCTSTGRWGWPLAVMSYGGFGCVYFARDCTGAIKVGWSKNPSERVKQIGGACKLLVTITGATRAHEHALHRLLAPEQARVGGEWFQGDMTESLISFLLKAAAKKASAA